MMMNLKRNGCLESVKGIVVGSMYKMRDNDIPWGKNALQIVEDVTKKYNIPMVYNFPAGHIRDNRALVMGSTVHLNVSAEKTVLAFDGSNPHPAPTREED
jgi:muramoyltetrapeptide carboxypeptidase